MATQPSPDPTADEATTAADAAAASFAELGLAPRVLKAVTDVGYETPTPIQAAVIPPLLAGRHVLGTAQTGTGKTAAFALPILSRISTRSKTPQALVLAPTRELAIQDAEAFGSYGSHLSGLHVLPVYGGASYGVQLGALQRGVDVVVGTPGRVIDHLNRGTLDLSQTRFVVLDEADEMLQMGFVDDVETILAQTPADKQVALFSATMPPAIRRIASRYLSDAAEISVKAATATADNINQRYLVVSYARKLEALTRLLELENFDAMIVFVRTKQEVEALAEKLRSRGLAAAGINGDVPQAARERMINQLRDGKLDILVATDVAARGLDVERVSHVINYDVPTDVDSYIHRIGRTGRAGHAGDAISFITPRERYLLGQIEHATKSHLSQMSMPSVDDVNASRLNRFDDSITAMLEDSERIELFRDVVAHYVREFDVPELDVAAALAAVRYADSPLLLDADAEVRREPEADDSGRGKRRAAAAAGSRPPRRTDLVPYRIAVGKRHKIGPRQIVGALANEGGLSREDFGAITIRPDHSIVELPAQLPAQAEDRLASTRISGRLIELRRWETSGRSKPRHTTRSVQRGRG